MSGGTGVLGPGERAGWGEATRRPWWRGNSGRGWRAVTAVGEVAIGDEFTDFGQRAGAAAGPGHALVLHALGEQMGVGAFLRAQATGVGGYELRGHVLAPIDAAIGGGELAGQLSASAAHLGRRPGTSGSAGRPGGGHCWRGSWGVR